MVEESQIPNTAEEIHATLSQLAVDLQTNKEFLQDEQLKYKRYEVLSQDSICIYSTNYRKRMLEESTTICHLLLKCSRQLPRRGNLRIWLKKLRKSKLLDLKPKKTAKKNLKKKRNK